jgi:hypothetical protein
VVQRLPLTLGCLGGRLPDAINVPVLLAFGSVIENLGHDFSPHACVGGALALDEGRDPALIEEGMIEAPAADLVRVAGCPHFSRDEGPAPGDSSSIWSPGIRSG